MSTPVAVRRADVETAYERIRSHVRATPIVEVAAATLGTPQPVVLKLELLQHTGSFKARGATNRVLAEPEISDAGLIAASGGNHGLAVAWVGHRLGLRVEIFVPETSPSIKVEGLRRLGATVHVGGRSYDEAKTACDARRAATGALDVHPFDHVDTVAGAGSVGLELDQQRPNLDTVLVAVGGGGLVAGVAGWFEEPGRVVGVEPETSCCWHQARVAGQPVDVEVGGVAIDSLGARRIGAIAYAGLTRAEVGSVLVPDDAIRAAQRLLWDELRLIVEPGGATSVAALLCGAYRPGDAERVAAVVCGANTDPTSILELAPRR